MKINELTMCANCEGSLVKKGGLVFYRIKVSSMFLDAQALNQVAGLHQHFQGKSLPLAEMFAADSEVAKEAPFGEMLLCLECATEKELCVLASVGAEEERKEAIKNQAAEDDEE